MKREKFIKIPEYPAGKVAFQKFIDAHLRIPEAALQNHIKGTVCLTAEIDDNGMISDVTVVKGLGYGCDEEALRLIRMLHFGGVSNKGIRVKTKKKFRIKFNGEMADTAVHKPDDENLKTRGQTEIRYFIKKEPVEMKPQEMRVYNYQITLDKDPGK